MNWRWVLILLGVGAVVGFTIFGVMLVDAVDVSTVTPEAAQAEIRDVLAGLESAAAESTGRDQPPGTLHVLTYRADLERLARAEVPLWFLELKEPALEFALRGVDVDLRARGLTVDQLRAHGRGLVLLEAPQRGDLLLVWLE